MQAGPSLICIHCCHAPCTQGLSSHAAKEELVVYPAVRTAMGDAVADRCLAEHAAVKGMLAQLDSMLATDPNFDPLLRTAVESMLVHVAEEEQAFLPTFAAALTPEALLQLGIQFEAAKASTPCHQPR